MLGSDLWDFSDAYIVVKETITVYKAGMVRTIYQLHIKHLQYFN